MKKILIFLFIILINKIGFAQNWIQKNNTYASISGSSNFAIGDTGYVVAGAGNGTWMYDTLVDSWTSEANYPGVGGGVKVGFALDGMGYVGTGTALGYAWYTEFYQYDPNNNIWTPEADFAGLPRGYAVGFVLDGKGYVGLGVGGPSGSGPGTNFHAYKDFYAYDPSNNKWTQIANYPGKGSQFNISFVIGDKAYVGCGETIDSSTWGVTAIDSDFWEYDTISKVWTRIANFAGGPRSAGTGFSTCGNGFVGLGYTDVSGNNFMNDFWQYTPSNNTWTPIANYGGAARALASSFIVKNSAWVGMGYNNSTGNFDDWWEYHVVTVPAFSADTELCQGGTITFTDTSTFIPDHWSWQFPGGTPDTSTKPSVTITYDTAGYHNVILTAWNSCDSATKIFTNYIRVNPYAGSLSITPDTPSVCIGQTITLRANGGAGAIYQWVGTSDTTDSILVNPTKDTTYELMVGSGSCSKDTLISVKVNTPPALVINPPSPVEECSGQGITLIADTTGRNYMWSPSTGLGATTGNTVLANPTVNVTYTVTGIDSLGCSVTATEELIVNQGPNKPIITVSTNGDTLISSAKNGNQWYLNGQPVKGAVDSVYVIIGLPKGDTVTVSVTDVANGCSTTSDSLVLSGINQLAIVNNQLSIYPNPSSGVINVNINSSAGEVKDWNLQLTDVLGRLVYSRASLNYTNEIDISNLPGGVYFITIKNKISRAVFPIVKQNY